MLIAVYLVVLFSCRYMLISLSSGLSFYPSLIMYNKLRKLKIA